MEKVPLDFSCLRALNSSRPWSVIGCLRVGIRLRSYDESSLLPRAHMSADAMSPTSPVQTTLRENGGSGVMTPGSLALSLRLTFDTILALFPDKISLSSTIASLFKSYQGLLYPDSSGPFIQPYISRIDASRMTLTVFPFERAALLAHLLQVRADLWTWYLNVPPSVNDWLAALVFLQQLGT